MNQFDGCGDGVSFFLCYWVFPWAATKSRKPPGASAARTTLDGGKGARDLWERWDESSLLGGCELLLHKESKFQVNVWRESFHKSPYHRCVTTPHHLACGSIDNKNTLAKVCTNVYRSQIFTHHPKDWDLFPQGNLRQLRSQEMPWSLGDIQLYASSCSWRMWHKKRIMVPKWKRLSRFPGEWLLRSLRSCRWASRFWQHSFKLRFLCCTSTSLNFSIKRWPHISMIPFGTFWWKRNVRLYPMSTKLITLGPSCSHYKVNIFYLTWQIFWMWCPLLQNFVLQWLKTKKLKRQKIMFYTWKSFLFIEQNFCSVNYETSFSGRIQHLQGIGFLQGTSVTHLATSSTKCLIFFAIICDLRRKKITFPCWTYFFFRILDL